jgi:hypothetical protein
MDRVVLLDLHQPGRGSKEPWPRYGVYCLAVWVLTLAWLYISGSRGMAALLLAISVALLHLWDEQRRIAEERRMAEEKRIAE